MEKWRAQEKDAQEKLDNDSKDLSKVSQKQTVLRQKVEECTNKIGELGAIPNPEMISKYMAYTQKNVSEQFVYYRAVIRASDSTENILSRRSCSKNWKKLTAI